MTSHDRGLNALEKLDPRKCKAIELRYFGGLPMEEIARGAVNTLAAKIERSAIELESSAELESSRA